MITVKELDDFTFEVKMSNMDRAELEEIAQRKVRILDASRGIKFCLTTAIKCKGFVYE